MGINFRLCQLINLLRKCPEYCTSTRKWKIPNANLFAETRGMKRLDKLQKVYCL